MTISIIDSSNHSNGSMALRDYFNELYLEKTGESVASSDNDCDDGEDEESFFIASESDVSLSSDEESFVVSNGKVEVDEDENDVPDSKININAKINISTKINAKINDNTDLNGGTNHTRRRRFRRSRAFQAQRPKFAFSSDNARGVRTKGTKEEELRVSTYQNKPGNKSTVGTGARSYSLLSASAHSLGSRTGISNTSVNKWRTTQMKARSALMSRNEHRDSRWGCTSGSTNEKAIPNGGLSNPNSSSRAKSYDFGFVNDSLHGSPDSRWKSKSQRKKRADIYQELYKSKTKQQTGINRYSCGKVIDSAVRVATDLESYDSSEPDGEEFYEEEDTSISSFTMDTLDTSKGSNTSSTGSSLVFGTSYKVKSKAMTLVPRRAAPARTRSVGETPRLPRRTQDSFDLNESASETFEPLKGGSVASSVDFQKTTVKRSMSTDSFMTFSNTTPSHFEKSKRRGSDPVGRWTATITRQLSSKDSEIRRDSLTRCPSPPRRVPSASLHSRTTGRNSNHSNDSSDASDSEYSFDFENSFAGYGLSLEDESLAATVATTGSSNVGQSSVSIKDQNVARQMLLPRYSGHHPSQIFKTVIPESLRKLPDHSFHANTTISSKSLNSSKKLGKSLHSTSRKWT